jgi:HprK-related kinase A
VRTPLAPVQRSIAALYAEHPIVAADAFVDFDVLVRRPSGLRRWWHPQVEFVFDGRAPFNPLPGDQGFALLEWGLNWCVYGQCHQHLTLHAAVLERNGHALILPAPSGSGKSTLAAALLHRGWRLLSDELALIDPASAELIPMPRPVSLKNASIDVMRRFVPGLEFGAMVHETSKGVVAHFAPPAAAVAAAQRRAAPGWIVFPRYARGSEARLEPMERARAFMGLVENAFNYDIFGDEGFELLRTLVDRSGCFSFSYSQLEEAASWFERLAQGSPRSVPMPEGVAA